VNRINDKQLQYFPWKKQLSTNIIITTDWNSEKLSLRLKCMIIYWIHGTISSVCCINPRPISVTGLIHAL
jgi:hypothetical protein